MIKLVLVGGVWLIFVVFSMYVCGGSDCVCDSLFKNVVYLVSLSLIMKTNGNFLIMAVIGLFVSVL